jgi:small subunit ribosomal protein S20
MAKLKTGRHTSALKAHRQSVKHAEQNVTFLSRIRKLVRKVETAVVAKDAKAARTALDEAFSVWDKAAKQGVIHWRSASRKKSRLSGRVQALAAKA